MEVSFRKEGRPAAANLEKVEGIGEVYGKKLRDAGVSNTDMLLEAGSTRKGRDELAAKTKIASRLILEWVNHVDLFRVKGVGEEYADLLEASGVDTVPDLARRRADNLHKKWPRRTARKSSSGGFRRKNRCRSGLTARGTFREKSSTEKAA